MNFSCSAVATGGGWNKVQALKMDEHIAAGKHEVALTRTNFSIALLNLQNSVQRTVSLAQ